LGAANSKQVAKFLWEDVICRYKIFKQLTVDGNPENKDVMEQLVIDYGIKRVVISAYNFKINGIIERGYSPIVNALAKITDGGKGNWVQNLYAVLWADRITVRKSTGYIPFYLNVSSEPILPIELDIPIWKIFPWGSVQTIADFLVLRTRQF
jgi:hypothetical protein